MSKRVLAIVGVVLMTVVSGCTYPASRDEMNATMLAVNSVAVEVRPMVLGKDLEVLRAAIAWPPCGALDGPVAYTNSVEVPSSSGLPDLAEFHQWAIEGGWTDVTRQGVDEYEQWEHDGDGVAIIIDFSDSSRALVVAQIGCVQGYDGFDLDNIRLPDRIVDLVEGDVAAEEYPRLGES